MYSSNFLKASRYRGDVVDSAGQLLSTCLNHLRLMFEACPVKGDQLTDTRPTLQSFYTLTHLSSYRLSPLSFQSPL